MLTLGGTYTADVREAYDRTASLLAEDEAVHRVAEIVQRKMAKCPFVAVIGPSGIGKTQLAFGLAKTIPVVYMVFGRSADSQPIYEAYECVSSALRTAVLADVKTLGLESWTPDLMSREPLDISGETLRVPGLFLALLSKAKVGTPAPAGEGFTYRPCRAVALREAVQAMEQRPVFIFDELPACRKDYALQLRIRYVRYVAKFCGLWAIFMGSDSGIANMLETRAHSRPDELSFWCHVVFDLPKSVVATVMKVEVDDIRRSIGRSGGVAEFVLQEVERARPLFGKWMIQEARPLLGQERPLTGAAFLDQLAFQLDGRLRAIKLWIKMKTLELHSGVMLQMKMLNGLAIDSLTKKQKEKIDPIGIFRHMARIEGHGTLALRNFEDCLRDEKQNAWVVRSVFPAMEKEPSLYLMSMGGWSPRGANERGIFCASGRKISTAAACREVYRRAQGLHDVAQNANALALSGVRLEFQTALAMIAASQVCGVGGCSLDTFFLQFVYEMSLLASSGLVSYASVRPSELLHRDDDDEFMIPYLGAMNQSWPSDLVAVEGARFGEIHRPKDAAQIDTLVRRSRVDGREGEIVMSAEQKNWEDPVSAAVIEQCLLRTFKSGNLSPVHIIVCNKAGGGEEETIARVERLLAENEASLVRIQFDTSEGVRIGFENGIVWWRKKSRKTERKQRATATAATADVKTMVGERDEQEHAAASRIVVIFELDELLGIQRVAGKPE